MIYDAIVVGAGPGGSSAASFIARRGATTLLLDKADFPRDKVCGDGLTPQAIYWLDQLGCVEEVLAETRCCVKECDLFINGEHILRGRFPENDRYPDFATLLDRRRLDHILMRNAVAQGASFKPKHVVKALQWHPDHIEVVTSHEGRKVSYRGRMVVGADGVSSAVSRAIGNQLRDGVSAVSLRTYFKGLKHDGAQVKVYFDRDYFPGYGWVFVDDDGFANVGMGYAFDRQYPLLSGLRETFQKFMQTDLAAMLSGATQCGGIGGGSADFYRPKRISADRVMLVGDAANQIDPLNGGGIHKAMESGFLAAQAAALALESGDFSQSTLQHYDRLWEEQAELDWRTAELFLSIAKNPDLKEFCLFLLRQIGRLTAADPQFQDFCSGVFSGVVAQSACLSPRALYEAFPKHPGSWLGMVSGERGVTRESTALLVDAVSSVLNSGRSMAGRPLGTVDWGLDVVTKAVQLIDRRLALPAQQGYSEQYY